MKGHSQEQKRAWRKKLAFNKKNGLEVQRELFATKGKKEKTFFFVPFLRC